MIKNSKYKIALFISILISIHSIYGQDDSVVRAEFIKVYSSQYNPIPPFPTIETEISNNQICDRVLLPPRKVYLDNKVYLDAYDSWDTIPICHVMEQEDYDSIVDFIMNSGILDIDLSYTEPDTTGGVISMRLGGASDKYVIVTSSKSIDLLL